ncbi:unnamed protein product [Adineta steineri]|uniref:S-phase kinase-associated protein 1 n=1 Tax=Adineta steineri TaxID=433720 RepID=A0A813UL79_9BILA|nr:unnamed protein product [Adineta steineri]CAF0941256.1 unnamed protein product [Adineta steineri]CAF0998458.1 unnamed protein product [Adineta steineri]CAF1110948.1 unnamed protein product [Adineta steineri]CAF1221404.1 unnamed protein product [Adineta steineri]
MATTAEASNTTTGNTETATGKMIKIQSNDGQIFEVDQGVVEQSSTIKTLSDLMDVGDVPIPLPNVKASILGPIVDFCNHHKNDQKPEPIDEDDDDDPNKDIYEPKRSDDICEWDLNFIKQFTVPEGTLFDIIMAANYLGIKTLLAVGCKTIANMVRGKSSTEVREMFNISYDPPGEGINAPNAIEGQAGTVPTTQDANATGPSPQPDPMNQ